MSVQQALRLAAAGYAVFPLGGDKAPVLPGGHKLATRDPDAIAELWAAAGDRAKGVGVTPGLCDPPLIALDLDRKGGIDGLVSLHAVDPIMAEEIGVGDIEPAQITPSGGLHLLFRSDGGEHRNTAGKIGPGIDTRGTAGYIRVYGDLPDPKSLPMAPGWLLEAGRSSSKPASTAPDRQPPPRPAVRRAAEIYLETEAPAAEEGRRNDTAFKVAAQLKNVGLDIETALALMLDGWNRTKCDPPLPDEELAEIVKNAFRYSQDGVRDDRLGSVARVLSKAREAKEINGAEQKRWRVYYGDEVLDLPPPEWIIPDLIAEDSVVIFAGTYGAYKSFVGLDLALSLASGQPFLGHAPWRPTKTKRVLYLCGEGAADMTLRYRAYTKARRTGHIGNCGFVFDMPQVRDLAEEDFAEILGDHDVVIIDTFARFTIGVDENSNTEVGEVLSMIEAIKKSRPRNRLLTVILIHHMGKSGNIRGATSLPASADTILAIERQGSLQALLRVEKQKAASTPDNPFQIVGSLVDVGNDRRSLVFQVVGEVYEEPKRTKAAKVDNWTATVIDKMLHKIVNGEPVEMKHVVSEIAQRSGVSPRDVEKALRNAALATNGSFGDGIWLKEGVFYRTRPPDEEG